MESFSQDLWLVYVGGGPKCWYVCFKTEQTERCFIGTGCRSLCHWYFKMWLVKNVLVHFCPFNLVAQVLQTLKHIQGRVYNDSSWLANTELVEQYSELTSRHSICDTVTTGVLQIPNTDNVHPLVNELNLVPCWLSGDPLKYRNFRRVFQNYHVNLETKY